MTFRDEEDYICSCLNPNTGSPLYLCGSVECAEIRAGKFNNFYARNEEDYETEDTEE